MTRLPFLLKKRNMLRLLALAVAMNLFALAFIIYSYSAGSPLLVSIFLSLCNLAGAAVPAWAWRRVYRIKDAP